MDPIRISAKNLGITAMADFCPRCYWLRLKTNHKLPWQIFPGIFASIDAYTKHCVHLMIDRATLPEMKSHNITLPEWMQEVGRVVGYEPVPHYSKSLYYDEKTSITISGAADDIWVMEDGSKVIPDYKTAKWTENQDKLFPMYEVQLNVYPILYRFPATTPLYLVYMQPETSPKTAVNNIIPQGFSMCFEAKVVKVEGDRGKVRKALTVTREIYELPTPPDSVDGCKECAALDRIVELLGEA